MAVATADKGSALTMAVENGKVVFQLVSPQKNKLDSIDKWLSAFHTFMAIFSVRHPLCFPELLKYAETIRMAALQFPGLGWHKYDEQFRMRQELNPSHSWAELDMELWVTVAAAAHIVPATNFHNTIVPLSKTLQGKGGSATCYAYNGSQGCRWFPCKFAHRCSSCMRFGHGASTCRVSGIGSTRANTAKMPLRPARTPRNGPTAGPNTGGAAPANSGVHMGKRHSEQQFNMPKSGKPTSFRPPNTN